MENKKQLSLPSKRADGILSEIGSRTSGGRGGNHESRSTGIEVSKSATRLQSEQVDSRRCELNPRANLFPTLKQPFAWSIMATPTIEVMVPPLIASHSFAGTESTAP